ncbi:MAG: ATP-binding cassette domain-containing protein [Actinomycetia bacterium]|nr:ATP-binding cassette domain-containing protein [Actinomycetes bacterium]
MVGRDADSHPFSLHIDTLSASFDIVSTSNTDPVIRVDRLTKNYGDVVAAEAVTFSVGRGEVLGLLGPNGAGKTTVVKMLTTLVSIDDGTATVAGFDVTNESESVRRVIGLAGQVAAVDEELTARENLELLARLYKLPRLHRRARIEELVERFDMGSFADRPASTYSGGQRRRLDIVAALVADPQALFLDGPTTGLDPRSRAEVWESIRALAATGTAILLTTQYLDEADQLANQILVIDRGRTVANGDPEHLKSEIGRDVLEIHVPTDADLVRASDLMAAVPGKSVDTERRRLDLPITNGSAQSLQLLRQLDDGDVIIDNFQLRRPTLDDVFLALTGAPTAPLQEVHQ